MPLPDFHDQRPYAHPEHPGIWRISAISSTLIILRHSDGHTTIDEPVASWPGDWQPTDKVLGTLLTAAVLGATEITPGIYRLADEHDIYAVPSASTDRIHTVILNIRTGHMRCDGPRCYGRTCSHQKRVLAVRAGF